jgi:hypothetical protein
VREPFLTLGFPVLNLLELESSATSTRRSSTTVCVAPIQAETMCTGRTSAN